MIRFIKQLFLFASIVFVAILIIDFATNSIINSHVVVKLKPNTKHIIIGHSHPECAYNDSLISNFQNMASSGECYFYNYQKLKKVIEQNPQLETVWLEYTNNSISKGMNDWIWEDKFINQKYPIYSAFLSNNEKLFLASKNMKSFLGASSLSVKKKIEQVLLKQYNISNSIGGYTYLNRSKTDSLINVKNSIQNAYPKLDSSISEKNVEYLLKIISLCKNAHKKIILVRSPQNSYYEGYNNELAYKNILNNQLKNVTYVDFSKFPLQNNEYADLEHLNAIGASKFSNWFNKLDKLALLKHSNKQLFVDNAVSKLQPSN